MEILDITGEIYTGMWNYSFPFPNVTVKPLPKVEWVPYSVYAEIFEGMHSQTGTYLETPAHLLGDKSYPLIDVSLDRTVNIPASVLKVGALKKSEPITAEMIKEAEKSAPVNEGDAVLVCTEWSRKWYDDDYLTGPYFTYDAMKYLISKKPSILASDFPRWDNPNKPQGFWQDFYNADILMLDPVVNLEKAPDRASLTVLPIKVEKTCCAPCRAILTF